MRMMVTVAIAAVLGTPALGQVPQPAERVTLDQLEADPQAFAGRTVELSGQMDECWSFTCHLCPLEASPAQPMWDRCLALSFERFAGPGGGRGAGREMDSAFRYADVRLVARFDPSCLTGLCTDRASVLRDARVDAVTRRRRSNDGLMHEHDPLKPLGIAAAAPIERLVRSAMPQGSIQPVRAFAVSSDPGAREEAVVCASRPGADSSMWPTTFRAALLARSTEDAYKCWIAQKAEHGWMLEPS